MSEELPALLGMVGARRFAQGGMADLFVADRVMPKGGRRRLVVKRMQPQLTVSEDLVKRFRDEARLGLMLRHSNIVRVLEYHELEQQHYMLMEAIDGVDLAEIMTICWDRGLDFPQDVAAYFMQGVASALAYMADVRSLDDRDLKLVHRDISPSNILVTTEGVIKLIDFGVAKSEERESSTRTGGFVGKYAYMSPEQVRGDTLDIRSDLFALGSVGYGILAARMAFQGGSGYEIMDAVVQSTPFPLPKLRKDIHPVLDQIISRCLQKNPGDRYTHPIHLVEDLNAYFHVAVDRPPSILAAEFVEALGLVERQLAPSAPRNGTEPGYEVMPVGGAQQVVPVMPPPRERTEAVDIFAGVDPPSASPLNAVDPTSEQPPEAEEPSPPAAPPASEAPTVDPPALAPPASEAETVEPPALAPDDAAVVAEAVPESSPAEELPSIESTLRPLGEDPAEPPPTPPRRRRRWLWGVLIGLPVLAGVLILVGLVLAGGYVLLWKGESIGGLSFPAGGEGKSATEEDIQAPPPDIGAPPSGEEATPSTAEEDGKDDGEEVATPEPPTPSSTPANTGGTGPATSGGTTTKPPHGKFKGSSPATPADPPSEEPAPEEGDAG